MVERLKKEYTRRLRMKLKSKLKSKNKFTVIRALAFPVLRCAFGVFNWRFKGIEKSTEKLERC
jgi:hypothetical protein